jgi:hypothetical protein
VLELIIFLREVFEEYNAPPGNNGFRFGLNPGLAVDPLLPRVGAFAPGLATALFLVGCFRPAPAVFASFFSKADMLSVAGPRPVVSLRKFRMLAGVMGAMSGLTEADADSLVNVVEDDDDDVVAWVFCSGLAAGGAGGGIERSTGDGVSFGGAKYASVPEFVPRVAGVEVAEGGVGALPLDWATVEHIRGETRLRMPACSSPLDEMVRLRCGRCCEGVNEDC